MKNSKIKFKKTDEDTFKKAFGIWKNAKIKDSVEYVREMRKGWEIRRKRLRL